MANRVLPPNNHLILFSSNDTDIGVGVIVPLESEQIQHWDLDEKLISWVDKEDWHHEMEYFDYFAIPIGMMVEQRNGEKDCRVDNLVMYQIEFIENL